MQAITVIFLGPTNTLGARLKATCQAGSVTIPFDYSVSGNYTREWQAALALIRKMEWDTHGDIWVAGDTKDGETVFTAKYDYTTFKVEK